MDVNREEGRLLAALGDGLPLVRWPYAALGERLGSSEEAVLGSIEAMLARGVIRRFGVVVRHHELGYRANAMVVWDVAADAADAAGRRLAELPYVTLAYRRTPRPPAWPYSLYCMIHGRERAKVEALIEDATRAAGLDGVPRAVLFSRQRFKQRGARYRGPDARAGAPA